MPFIYLFVLLANIGAFATSRHSVAALLNGTFIAVLQPYSPSSSSSSSFYVQDPVHIVYAVGRHVQDLSYRLEVNIVSAVQRIPLNDFDQVESLRDRLNGRQWPSEIPLSAVGGIVDRRFSAPGVYAIVFVVSGRTTHNGNEESVRVETTVTVSRRPTLQVQVRN